MNRHHKLLEEMGHLKDREGALLSENDQLRAQLVEMKEQEKKKYDDLMVQYNLKREYEDGTLTNQVTVKTESDDEDVKVEIKQDIKEEHEEDHNIYIKQEYVPEYIKTESDNEDVKLGIKQEIKEEYDDNDDCGHDLRLVKKELVSDDDDNSMQIDEVIQANLAEPKDILSRDQVNRPMQSVFELSPSGNCQMQLTNSSQIEQSVDQQVDKADHESNEPANHGHNQWPTTKQSQSRTRKRPGISLVAENSSFENSLTGGEVSSPGPMTNSKRTRVSSSLERGANADQMSPQSKVDLSDGDDPNGIDSSGEGENCVGQSEDEETWLDCETELGEKDQGGRYKIEIVKLKCTEDACEDEVLNRVELHDHLRVKHLTSSPHRCLAEGCNERFEQWKELGPHVHSNHSNIFTWSCSHCTKTFNTHHLLYNHLYWHHFEGQFKCGYDECHYDRVATFRSEIRSHQLSVHPKTTMFTCQFNNCGKLFNHKGTFNRHQLVHTAVKHFRCDWIGCGKSFAQKFNLDIHQRIHQKVKPFRCTWNLCDYASTDQSNAIRHIRAQHFGLPASQKEQRQRGIEDNRNARDYLLNTTTPI